MKKVGFYDRNVIALTNASGLKAWYEYSPFGVTLTATGDAAELNPFRFSSEYADSETGLVYYNYRYYNPELGRWLSRDPYNEWFILPINEFGQSINLKQDDFYNNKYLFCNNNVTNRTDRLGLSSDDYSDCWKDAQESICGNLHGIKKWFCEKFIGLVISKTTAGSMGECEAAYDVCNQCCTEKMIGCNIEDCGAYCLRKKLECQAGVKRNEK